MNLEAEAVFVGHGIVNEQEKWNDYKDVNVKGKVVVLFTNEPQPDNPQVFKGRTLTYAGRWVYKFEEAARQGARRLPDYSHHADGGLRMGRGSEFLEQRRSADASGTGLDPARIRGLANAGSRGKTARACPGTR